MSWLSKTEGYAQINTLGKARTPFLFIISYDQEQIFAQPLDTLEKDILYKVEETRNYLFEKADKPKPTFTYSPIAFSLYQSALSQVIKEIEKGNTYLLNLTFKTPIETEDSLHAIFKHAKAKFKLYYKDTFICFSPERFVEMEGNQIATYPMKGTIDATLPQAKARILADEKEMAEHTMIVDLMRNDLGMIASQVKVKKFRYVEEIEAGQKRLLQVSSKITATLPKEWQDQIGTLLSTLLPAGSITGAPKRRTTEIIEAVEDFDRGFYTGVFGVYDGKRLRSAVMIRFIQKEEEKLFYKSGGGITIDSKALEEYHELIDKIYFPF